MSNEKSFEQTEWEMAVIAKHGRDINFHSLTGNIMAEGDKIAARKNGKTVGEFFFHNKSECIY